MANSGPIWRPSLFGKQNEIYDTRKRLVLAEGSRISGKTMGVCQKVLRHMTETPMAQVGAFATSIKAAKDCGSWQLLHRVIAPEWLSANLLTRTGRKVEYISENWSGEPGPKRDSNTRSEYFSWRNIYDGQSDCTLFSVHNMDEIASIVKQKNFSLVWLMELSTFKDSRIIYMTMPCLRMKHLTPFDGTPNNFHQLLADTNPDEALGDKSWIYELFHTMRDNPRGHETVEKLKKWFGDDPEIIDQFQEYLNEMEVIWMHWSENPHVTKQQINDLRFGCLGDEALLDSSYRGTWGKGGAKSEKHFAKFFSPSEHIVGGGPGEGTQIDLSENSPCLYVGWDIGKVNHAVSMLDKVLVSVGEREMSSWNLLDEMTSIGAQKLLEDFVCGWEENKEWVPGVLDKMLAIEKASGKKLQFVHWADDSAINVFNASTGSFDYLDILAASRQWIKKQVAAGVLKAADERRYEINLKGVAKPAHSRERRVRLLQGLLQTNRFHASYCCGDTQEMLADMKQSPKEFIVKGDNFQHIFDAITYPIFSEMREELIDDLFKPNASQREEKQEVISL